MYVKRKDGGRGLISVEACVRSEENNLGLYIRDSNEQLWKGVKYSGIIKTEDVKEKKEFKNDTQGELKTKWKDKGMYGQFIREMPHEVDRELSWQRLC